MTRTAFVTGITGQDGAYLCKLLLEKGYKVYGGVRRTSSGMLHRLAWLGIENEVEVVPFELGEIPCMARALERARPDEFYNLAAQSFVATSWDCPLHTTDVDAVGVCRILELIRNLFPHTRFYQASTSEMFGLVQQVPQTERTPFYPRSPYGVAKLYAHWTTVNYRESFDLYTCSGILFNHESPLRGVEFVTRKITFSLARIVHGQQDVLELGNLSAERDWGFAGDYVEGMWRILQQSQADDFVLATGRTCTVREFVEAAARALGIDVVWEGSGEEEKGINRANRKVVVRVNPAYYRPAEVDRLVGDAGKANAKLGWKPRVNVEELATMMASADFDRVACGWVPS